MSLIHSSSAIVLNPRTFSTYTEDSNTNYNTVITAIRDPLEESIITDRSQIFCAVALNLPQSLRT
jgi:hypothetical protein